MALSLIKTCRNVPAKQLQQSLLWQAAYTHRVSLRFKSGKPINTVMMFVPQQEAWVVERMGRFHRILDPGFNLLLPVVDKVKYVQSLKEIAIEIPQQSAITVDNVTLNIDGVLYLRVFDPYKASYGVEDPEYAITQLAQTTMRSEVGKIQLDTVFRERESLNIAIVEAVNKAAEAWGIICLRYEIRDMRLPTRITEAMQMQVEAERKKRAAILESEGMREAEINVAEGKKRSQILSSEGWKTEQINRAAGEANAILAKAEARAKSLHVIAKSLVGKDGINAASLNVAEQYVGAFSNLAKQTNTVIVPANAADMSSMVSQALAVYRKLSSENLIQSGADKVDVTNQESPSSSPSLLLKDVEETPSGNSSKQRRKVEHDET